MHSPRILFEVSDDLSTSAIAVGDVTRNGLSELCTGGRDGMLRVYDANGPEVRMLAQLTMDGSILSLKIGDANNDGDTEIVLGRSLGTVERPGEAGTVQVYRYADSGHLELLAECPVDRFVTTVVVTDVTGDGKNEIVVGGSDSTLRILRMGADNSLVEMIRYQMEDMPIAIGTCDVIGDEIDEIVTGNRDNTLRVFKVKGHSLEQVDIIELQSPIISVAAGDTLGDRKMELGVVTHDGSIRIYRNEESRLDLFTRLEGVNALSIRMAEINADHMDEIVVATSDHKIRFYNVFMGELQELAVVDVGTKILSISVGDAGGDDRKEVLVGVSNGPLKVIEGLYEVIPKFEVSQQAQMGTDLVGRITVANVTDGHINGITGKIYWFPKEHMTVTPEQLSFDLGPYEQKSVEVRLTPLQEGTVVVRPIMLMWKEENGNLRQVTTPETAVLVHQGQAIAAPAREAPVTFFDESPAIDLTSAPLFAPIKPRSTESTATTDASVPGPAEATATTGGTEATVPEATVTTATTESSSATDGSGAHEPLSVVKEAEELLERLFGETVATDTPPPAVAVEGPDTTTAAGTDVAAAFGQVVEGAQPTAAAPQVQAVESALVTEIRSRPPKPLRPGVSPEAYTYLFKCMVLGEGAVGKTTLVNRYVTGVFERDYKLTVGSQFAVKLTHISPPDSEYAVGVKLQVWDVAGQPRFEAVRRMYYSGTAGVILVFDVTRRRSFTELEKWVAEADESIGSRVPMLVVGNKIDLPDRTVSSDEAKAWAEANGFLYMESSAKTGEGVADMFTVLSELMYREARQGNL